MNLFKKIKLKLIEIGLNNLIKLSLLLNFPVLTSFLFNLAAGSVGHGSYTVLCLGRSIFTDDIKALVTYSGQIKYRILHLRYLDMLLNWFIPPAERRELTENNYHVSKIGELGRQKCYTYLTRMLPSLLKFMDLQAVISGNFGYIQQQELARVCQDQAVPFIVLHKEGMAIVGAFDNYVEQYRQHKFIGAKMLLNNEQIRNAMLKIKIEGLFENKMEVVGIPRLDSCFLERNYHPSAKQITFFSFYPRDKFHYLITDQKIIDAIADRSAEFHKLVIEFAQKHPEYQVIIKTKVAEHYVSYVTDIVNAHFAVKPQNLLIINVGEPADLVKESVAVLGFNSTTLIEAMVANRLIISPYMGDIITDIPWDYFTHYPELVNYARNYQELEEYILNYQKYLKHHNQQRENKFLEELIYTPDGRASERTEQAIINAIKNYAPQRK